MVLHDALRRRGYTFRRHLEEEGWTRRTLTVVDLTDAQRSALMEGGEEGLRGAVERDGVWTFPAMDIEAPLPAVREIVLADGGRTQATPGGARAGARPRGRDRRLLPGSPLAPPVAVRRF